MKSFLTQVQTIARTARHSKKVKNFVGVARIVAMGPGKELATICGRAGVAGAVVDAGMGGVHAANAFRKGEIDAKQAGIHVAAEAGCGFVTSASGTAGTLAIYMVTGSLGPAALVMGMGASMGSRYLYRRFVGDTLPVKAAPPENNSGNSGDDFENIGPK